MRLVSAKFVPCGFCITMKHRATHRSLCSNSSPRKTFLSSPNHRNLWISLRMTFGCSLLLKWASRWRVSHHGGHQIECDGRTPEDSKRSLPPVHPTMEGSMEQVCVCATVWLWSWLGKHRHMSYHYSAIPQFRELCDCPSYYLQNTPSESRILHYRKLFRLQTSFFHVLDRVSLLERLRRIVKQLIYTSGYTQVFNCSSGMESETSSL